MDVYVDGKLVPKDEASISVFDHGLLYGDGIFEGIRAYNGRVFRLDEHLHRLYIGLKVIKLHLAHTPQELKDLVIKTLRHNGMRDAYIRLVITRGKGDLGIDPRNCKVPTVIIITDKITLYPPELYEKGLPLVTVVARRNNPEALNPKVKSLNYLNNILGRLEANAVGAGEGLMLNQDGYVAEATADNIFVVERYAGRMRLRTPPSYVGALEGITRGAIMELAPQLGYEVLETPFTRHGIWAAEEAFLTGTGAEIIPVATLDGRPVGDGAVGPVTKEIMREFKALVSREGTPIFPEEEGTLPRTAAVSGVRTHQ